MMTMTQIFGTFREGLPTNHEFLVIGFSPSSRPIQQRWRNNGLSADFAADYLATFFPVSIENPVARRRQIEVKGAVSYIANELLENAMKFNDDQVSSYPIKFGLHLIEEEPDVTVVLSTSNSVSAAIVERFQTYIQELLASDTDEMYLRQLEKNAEEEHGQGSGLGLLTMMNDYAAILGWKFEQLASNPAITVVTTMVQLKV